MPTNLAVSKRRGSPRQGLTDIRQGTITASRPMAIGVTLRRSAHLPIRTVPDIRAHLGQIRSGHEAADRHLQAKRSNRGDDTDTFGFLRRPSRFLAMTVPNQSAAGLHHPGLL